MKAIRDMLKQFLLDRIKGIKYIVITHYTWSNISSWFPCCLFCLGFQHSFGYSQWTTGAQTERRWLRNCQKEEGRRVSETTVKRRVLLSRCWVQNQISHLNQSRTCQSKVSSCCFDGRAETQRLPDLVKKDWQIDQWGGVVWGSYSNL